MAKFSFRLADRLGIYLLLSNLVNKYILSRNTLDMERIADIYSALDGFWLKNKDDKEYNSDQIRVIIGSIIYSLRNNHLSPAEIRIITNHVVSNWRPEIAEAKQEPEKLIQPRVEETALRSVEVYDRIKPRDIADFVTISAPMVSHALPADRIVKTIGRFFR